MTQKYGANAVIVFDGYADEPTTKDATHLRRTGGYSSVTVHFTGSMVIQSKKENLLGNDQNKQRFIQFLSNKLEQVRCVTFYSTHDADVLIARIAVASARIRDTVLIGDDTDLLVLLLHHAEMDRHDVFFDPKPRQTSMKNRVWCIKQSRQLLGPEVCNNILFIHAILGCDTNSHPFGLGKGLAVKKIQRDPHFRKMAHVFNRYNVPNKEAIIETGENALVFLYGGDQGKKLNTLHYKMFCEKVSKKHVTCGTTVSATNFRCC